MGRTKEKRRKESAVPNKFVPRFFEEVDQRTTVYKTIRGRITKLMEDAGAVSYQQELICQEAVFVCLLLETARTKAAETGELDSGSYIQMVNCLSGLLNKLGLKKQASQVETLQGYLSDKGGAS